MYKAQYICLLFCIFAFSLFQNEAKSVKQSISKSFRKLHTPMNSTMFYGESNINGNKPNMQIYFKKEPESYYIIDFLAKSQNLQQSVILDCLVLKSFGSKDIKIKWIKDNIEMIQDENLNKNYGFKR